MTTLSANFNWVKPDPTEPADIRVINTLLDDMDTDIELIQNNLTSKIYKAAAYRIKRKWTYIGDGVSWALNEADLWEELWATEKYNAGEWTFSDAGILIFTSPGIYKITYQYTLPTYALTTTSGTVSIGLNDVTLGDQVARTKTYVKSVTSDGFGRTTMQAACYVWAGTGTDQCTVGTDYYFTVQNTSTAGAVNMIATPNDLLPWRSMFTLECVRKLAA